MTDSQEIVSHWPLSGVSLGEASSTYAGRRVIAVHADEGDFVVKIDSTRELFLDEAYVLALDFVADAGFAHAPTLLRTRSGDRLARTSEGVAYVMERVPRGLVSAEEPRATSWRDVGRAAAQLNSFRDFEPPFAIPIEAALVELRHRADGLPFERQLRTLLERLAVLGAPGRVGLIHGELNESNIGRRRDGTVVFLDWDQAGTSATALEYGYPLITTFIAEEDLAFDEATAAGFYAGYAEAGGVIEPSRLFDAALFHALRYMWFGDVTQRWERIAYAVRNEAALIAALF